MGMAQITQNHTHTIQDHLDANWMRSESGAKSEPSDVPIALHREDQDMAIGDHVETTEPNIDYEIKQMSLKGPGDEEDVLHPLREVADRIGCEVERFAEFFDVYNPQKTNDPSERQEMMFKLIKQYHNIALETVERLREKHSCKRRKEESRKWRRKMRGIKITQHDGPELANSDECDSTDLRSNTTVKDLEHWEQEAQTWDLLQRLATVRYSAKLSAIKPIHRYTSKQELWENFLGTEELALERKTVLQWLKDTAEESGEDLDVLVEDLQKNAERGDIIAHGWLHTKAAIKDHKRRIASSKPLDPRALVDENVLLNSTKTEPLSTQLDPDAPTRQGRKLAAQDEYFERAIWLGCYELLRRGISPKNINDWCMERTEIWRAVSILGMSFEDSFEDGESVNVDAIIRWRRMCLSMARNGSTNDYERAVYGILSGDMSSVEQVCKTWDDFVFNHYNSLLRTQFDNFLKKLRFKSIGLEPNTLTGNFDNRQIYNESQSTGLCLITSLMANPRTSKESTKPMKVIQGVLIADQFPNFIFQQGLVLSRIANAKEESRVIPPSRHQLEDGDLTKYIALDDHDSLRVLTHVLLILMGLGLDLGDVYRETEVQNVIVAYVSFLRLAGKEELIPLYCSQLSGKRKYSVLSRNLIDVTEEEQRIIQLKLMRELGLDTQEFVSLQARYLLDDFPDLTPGYPALGNFKLFSDSLDTVSASRTFKKEFIGDDESVERIDLLLIRSLQWYLLVDGLWVESFRLGTLFYLRFYKHMNLCAAKMLSINVPSELLMERKTRAVFGESVNLFENENIGDDPLKAHMLGEASNFKELECLIECLDSIDTAACLFEIKKQGLSNRSPPVSQNEWRNSYQKACEDAQASAKSLIQNWLITTPNGTVQDDLRLTREVYLPETLLAYITMLQHAGQHLNRDFILEAMELSSVLAEDDSDTLEVLVKTGYLQEIVDSLARASKALLYLPKKNYNTSRGTRKKKQGWTMELWDFKS